MQQTWKRLYSEARRTRATGKELATLVCNALDLPAEQDSFWGAKGLIALSLQRAVTDAKPAKESERYRQTRTVLNSFGRLNPWNGRFRNTPAARRDSAKVARIRAALLAKRLIAPEPGGYVTGLLAAAPSRFWWEGYPRPVASRNPADVALYEGRATA